MNLYRISGKHVPVPRVRHDPMAGGNWGGLQGLTGAAGEAEESGSRVLRRLQWWRGWLQWWRGCRTRCDAWNIKKEYQYPVSMSGVDHPGARLLWAAQHDRLEVARELLELQPSLVTFRDEDEYTALHRAAYSHHHNMLGGWECWQRTFAKF